MGSQQELLIAALPIFDALCRGTSQQPAGTERLGFGPHRRYVFSPETVNPFYFS